MNAAGAEVKPETPTVLVTGGTAQVGLHLLPALRAAGFTTQALSRTISPGKQPGKQPGPVVVEDIRWLHPDQYRLSTTSRQSDSAKFENTPELLISAGPITLAVELLRYSPGIKRVVCLSTSSVFSKAESGNLAERQQIAGIIQAEQQLQQVCDIRKIDLCILRPTMIYGCGLDENVSRIAKFIQRFGFLPLAGQATGLRQPVHVADLAALVVRVCLSNITRQSAFAVAGGSTLSYREMVAKIFQAFGKRPLMPSLPVGLLAAVVSLVSSLGGMKGLNAAMLLRQNQDLVFDDYDVRHQFSFQPRTFEPGPDDFTLSAQLRRYLPGA